MEPQSGRKRTRRDERLNQPYVPDQGMLNNWGNGHGPWSYPPPPFPAYSECDQFSAAYHSDRRDSFQNPYQSPHYWSPYSNNQHQNAYGPNGGTNFQRNYFQKNGERDGANFVENVEENNQMNPLKVVGSGTDKDTGTSQNGKMSTSDHAQGKITSSKEDQSQNGQKKKGGKKISLRNAQAETNRKEKVRRPQDNIKNRPKNKNHVPKLNLERKLKAHKSRLKSAVELQKISEVHQSPAARGVQQGGTTPFGTSPSPLRKSPRSGVGLLGPPPVPFGRAGRNGGAHLGNASQNGIGPFGRFSMPLARGRGRGSLNLFARTQGSNWNDSKCTYEEEDESNEINNWLMSSRGEESVSGKDINSVSKDPLPGSEEARSNAIKEAADRLKQALKIKSSVNLNELLTSEDESKNYSQSQSKGTTFPKNLAQLELDASDMRAIGRANTENANCPAEDNSDDDIIEVQRPPLPVPQVIDLETSPTKVHDNSSSSSSDDSDSDVSFSEKLHHIQNQSLDMEDVPSPESDNIPLSRLQDDSSEDRGNVPLSPKTENLLNQSLNIDNDPLSSSSENAPIPSPESDDIPLSKMFQLNSKEDKGDVPTSPKIEHVENPSQKSDDDVPLSARLEHCHNLTLSLENGANAPSSPILGNIQNPSPEDGSDDDVPLDERLHRIQSQRGDCVNADEHSGNVPWAVLEDTVLSERLQHLQNPVQNNSEVSQMGREKECLLASQPTNEGKEAAGSNHSQTTQILELDGEKGKSLNTCSENDCVINMSEPVTSADNAEVLSHSVGTVRSAPSSPDAAVSNADSALRTDIERNDTLNVQVPISGTSQVTVSPRVSLARNYPNEGRMSRNYPLSPAPNLNQRRRRASSSSLGETSSPRSTHTGSSHLNESSAKNGNCEPFLSSPSSNIPHDSRQRKIISGLRKMNQSKLKDLINNPGSGKLDFAMKQLMKEHRSVLSKTSRDVAEKRIPAEFLNPKSTELPPDDGTLLADFAIDWSSLPGELISTLGDLFGDFNSETSENRTETQCRSSSEPCEILGTDLLFPGYTPDSSIFNENKSLEEGREDVMLKPTESRTEPSNSARIRVCQFARENVNLPLESSEASALENNFEHSSPEPFLVPVATETNLIAGQSVQTDINHKSKSNESKGDCRIPDRNQTQDLNVACLTTRSSEDVNRSSESLGVEVSDSNIVTEPPLQTQAVSLQERVSVEEASSNLSSAARPPIRKTPEPVKGKKTLNKQPIIPTAKRKRYVHLEERSWFVESASSSKTKSSLQCNTKKVSSSNPPIHTTINSNGSEIAEPVPSEDNIVVSTPDHNEFMVNENQRNSPDNITSYSAQLSDVTVDQDQSVTMLPVLMMTVPANETSNAVCNLTVAEMQKRILEIDAILQDLVQERCILAQSLKAAATAGEGLSDAPPSQVEEDSALIEVDNVETVSIDNCAIEIPRESAKRRCSTLGDDDMASKRVCHGDSQSSSSIAKSGSNVVSLEVNNHVQPVQNCSNDCSSQLETNPTKNSTFSDDAQTYHEFQRFIKHPPFHHKVMSEVPGPIGKIRTLDNNIFAASGSMVYWVIDAKEKYVQGYFGDKSSPIVVRCFEIVNSCLFIATDDGVLKIYDIPNLLPNCYLHPKPKHTCTIAKSVLCSVRGWDRVYFGTREGAVIPFNTTNFEDEKRLFEVGHPILSMIPCMDNNTRVLVVAFRRHPIQIRNANTGALLRSFGGFEWTVYHIVRHEDLIYCGANHDKISVFCFKTGKEYPHLKAGLGQLAMSRYGNHLICGCHDGKIFIFDLKSQLLVLTLTGPGGMMYAAHFHRGQLLCGSQHKPFVSIANSCVDEALVVSTVSKSIVHSVSENKEDEVSVISESIGDEVSIISGAKEGAISAPSKNSTSTSPYNARTPLEGNILAFKVHDETVFAASSNGVVYGFVKTNMGYRWPDFYFGPLKSNGKGSGITCLEVISAHLYTGSEDGMLRIYPIPTKSRKKQSIKPLFSYNISNAIQCMHSAWDFLYVGTKVGTVIPFNIATNKVEDSLFTENSPVLCIKSCREGPRTVLLVASRQQPIAIRDAKNGLLLRSFGSCGWTVYSVLWHNNLVFCGANTNKISAFDFQSGELKFELNAGQGIIDMKVFRGILFCGCYDGKIYGFSLKDKKLVSTWTTPGNGKMILALDFKGDALLCSIKDHPLTVLKRALKNLFFKSASTKSTKKFRK